MSSNSISAKQDLRRERVGARSERSNDKDTGSNNGQGQRTRSERTPNAKAQHAGEGEAHRTQWENSNKESRIRTYYHCFARAPEATATTTPSSQPRAQRPSDGSQCTHARMYMYCNVDVLRHVEDMSTRLRVRVWRCVWRCLHAAR